MRTLLLASFLIVSAVGMTDVTRAAQAPIIPEGPTVLLPPLIVEETKTPLKWRYFQAQGLEVLSTAPDSKATAVVERTLELEQMLAPLLPDRFRGKSSRPETLVLLDPSTAPAAAQELLDRNAQGQQQIVRHLPNVALNDRDGAMTLATIGSQPTRIAYTDERIAGLLESRTPALPPWFIEGMKGFYHWLWFLDSDVHVEPMPWVQGEMQQLAQDGTAPRMLLPIADMLAYRPGQAFSSKMDARWRLQCTLFMYWVLMGDSGVTRKEGLWKLVDRLDQAPASEAIFKEYLGFGYAEMRDELSDYLPLAMRPFYRLKPLVSAGARPVVTWRDATPVEIARLRGDLERLEAGFVRGYAPAAADTYLGQARRTIANAYGNGERDPQLLAVAGLTELEAGNPTAALPFLEAAAEGHVTRPRVYFELARLRYEALGKPGPRLQPEQVATVMAPLLAAHRLEPPLLEVYALMAEVLSRGTTVPTAEQLAALHAGAQDFAHVPELVIRAIGLHRAAKQPAAAAALVQAGLRRTTDPAARTRIEAAGGAASAEH